jgi:type VI protein secretion system component Hcp
MPETDVAGKASQGLLKHCCTGEHLKKIALS